MCDRLQGSKERSSRDGQADIAEKVIGFDGFNNNLTGGDSNDNNGSKGGLQEYTYCFHPKSQGGGQKWIARERKPERGL